MNANIPALLLDHLWQSTVFGLAAAGTALALRRYRPAVRYWLWLAASLKFLFPAALLMDVGGRFRMQGMILPPSAQHVTQTILAPASSAATTTLLDAMAPTVVHASLWLPMLAVLWMAGFVAIVLEWVRAWQAIEGRVRAAAALDLGLPIRTVLSSARTELGVFGIFRPVLIVPAGLLDFVTDEQLHAILAHELCHVRRRDNLWATLHQLAKAIFWFHPLVWWAGARMASERELACDEYVMRRGALPDEYAECILRVCRFYQQAPMCMAGISGASLKRRVLIIADGAFGRVMGLRTKFVLCGLAALCVTAPFVVGASSAEDGGVHLALAAAQFNAPLPQVEAASLRLDPLGKRSSIIDDPGRTMISDVTLVPAPVFWTVRPL